MKETIEELAENLHIWYLEACQKPDSGMDFNPAAQEPYENLKETQKYLDRYIAGKILQSQTQDIKKKIEGMKREVITKSKIFAGENGQIMSNIDEENVGYNKAISDILESLDK